MLVLVPSKEPRYCVAQVPEEARDIWRNFCEDRLVSRSSFCEVIGVWFTAHPDHPLVQQWLLDAKNLVIERNRRD